MNDRMSRTPPSRRDWLPFVSFELDLTRTAWPELEARLVHALQSLGLPAEILEKVTASTHDSLRRAAPGVERTCLLIFTAAYNPGQNQCWGFFRTERHEPVPEKAAPDGASTHCGAGMAHTISYYLYVEDDVTPD
jgi:hypothetical protein